MKKINIFVSKQILNEESSRGPSEEELVRSINGKILAKAMDYTNNFSKLCKECGVYSPEGVSLQPWICEFAGGDLTWEGDYSRYWHPEIIEHIVRDLTSFLENGSTIMYYPDYGGSRRAKRAGKEISWLKGGNTSQKCVSAVLETVRGFESAIFDVKNNFELEDIPEKPPEAPEAPEDDSESVTAKLGKAATDAKDAAGEALKQGKKAAEDALDKLKPHFKKARKKAKKALEKIGVLDPDDETKSERWDEMDNNKKREWCLQIAHEAGPNVPEGESLKAWETQCKNDGFISEKYKYMPCEPDEDNTGCPQGTACDVYALAGESVNACIPIEKPAPPKQKKQPVNPGGRKKNDAPFPDEDD